MALLGVHLIVRDEAELLPRCLDSVRAWADEIVVVDTGSTDGTPDIARAAGAIVVEEPWRDDFAAARNAGLARARTEWVLVLDADETVVAGAAELREWLGRTSADAGRVAMLHATGARPEEAVASEAVRLFRTSRGFRYEGRVHEQLTARNGDKRMPPASERSPLRLVHDGYLPERLAARGKAERNLRLLTIERANDPGNPFHLYNAGVAHCQLGRLTEAEEGWRAALAAAPPNAPYRPTLLRDLARLLTALNRHGEALVLLEEGVEAHSGYPDLHLLRGECLEAAGLPGEAFDAYGRAAGCDADAAASYIAEAGARSYRAWCGRARCAAAMGQWQAADALYQLALAERPGFAPALAGWAEAQRALGAEDGRILAQLVAAAGAAEPRALADVAAALAGCGADEAALEALRLRQTALRASGQADGAAAGAGETSGQTGAAAGTDETSGQTRAAAGTDEASGQTGAAAGTDETSGRTWAEPSEVRALRIECLIRSGRLAEAKACLAAALANAAGGDGGSAAERLDAALVLAAEGAELQPPELWARTGSSALAAADRAFALRLPQVGERLLLAAGEPERERLRLLNRHGYVGRLADALLKRMEREGLDAEGQFALGEILCDRGHDEAASALFEQAIAQGDGAVADRARLGASHCYLQLAKTTITEAIRRWPEVEGLRQEAVKLEQALAQLGRIAWRTARTGRERRNANG